MSKQRRFTREFEDGAVRLVATSGRLQRAVAIRALAYRRWYAGSAIGVIGWRRRLTKRRRQILLPS